RSISPPEPDRSGPLPRQSGRGGALLPGFPGAEAAPPRRWPRTPPRVTLRTSLTSRAGPTGAGSRAPAAAQELANPAQVLRVVLERIPGDLRHGGGVPERRHAGSHRLVGGAEGVQDVAR